MKRVPEGHRVFNMITSPCKRVRKSAINFSQKLGSPDLPQDECGMTIPLSTAHYHFFQIFQKFLKDQRFWTFKCEIKTCEKRLVLAQDTISFVVNEILDLKKEKNPTTK